MTQNDYLAQIDRVIAQGPFTDTWESLCNYKIPKWYEDVKFGIFIHWGVYSVPAFGNEWYPRNMYRQGTPEYEHHLKTYGAHNRFGYKDFIPMFKGEHFNAGEWMQLFAAAGAKYVMPVAEHHDGFQMYESDLSCWNAKNMGPCRDVIGELREAAEQAGIIFAVSYHRAEHCWFFNGGLACDSDVADPENAEFYGRQQAGSEEESHDIYAMQPDTEHLEQWLARLCELVEKYRPRIVWFDWWIQNIAFKPYLKKFAAYYYNRAAQWGIEVAINYKYSAYAYQSAVFDVERGQLGEIRPYLWQTDTAVAKNSWGYTHGNDFKNPVDIVGDLVDIVSKNGCLLLNVGPKPDGSFTKEDRDILLEIGKWLAVNGEGIYGTRFWTTFGEGPTPVPEGAFTDVERAAFTSQDIRFTYKNGTLYAFVMAYPQDGKIDIVSCACTDNRTGDFAITQVEVLGYDAPVYYIRDKAALHVQVKGKIETAYPVCLKIKID